MAFDYCFLIVIGPSKYKTNIFYINFVTSYILRSKLKWQGNKVAHWCAIRFRMVSLNKDKIFYRIRNDAESKTFTVLFCVVCLFVYVCG